MAEIVAPPKPKQVKCSDCRATIAYLPEEVQRYDGRDIGGGPDGWERVKCPRENCPGFGYISRW